MKAVILVGGFGTRLRPLTLSKPKSLVEFVNKPIVSHQIDALVKVGVDHVILAVSYLPEMLNDFINRECNRVGIKITPSVEDAPLDTAGPVGLASPLLSEDAEDFFVLNCDVICSFPLEQMLRFHRSSNAEGTIMVTKVNEPSRYGVVIYDTHTGQIDKFVEKPKTFVGNRINAGIYLFKPETLSRFKAEPLSMEKDVFPAMARDRVLYAFELDGFWMDVGQPRDFLLGTALCMENQSEPKSTNKSEVADIINPVSIHPTCQVGKFSKIGPNVVLGQGVRVGEGVRLKDCTVLANTTIGNHSWISSAIVGWNCKIGKWVRVENCAVIGENVTIKDEIYINGGSILPHKSIGESIATPKVVM